jgi:hypothetical protein
MELLKCPICKDRFKSTPIFLPCGWTVCDTHVHSSLASCCSMCGKKHSAESEYHINKPVAIQLNITKFTEHLDRVAKKLARVKQVQRDPLSYLIDLSQELTSQISAREIDAIRALHAYFSSAKKSVNDMVSKHRANSNQVNKKYSI